jgi:uncharacterized protein YaiL (DUF2058 family)
MASLQDQLLKAGVVDAKKAKEIAKEKRKKAKQRPKGQAVLNETREQAQQARAEKAERDRELNRQQREAAEQRAIAAQIRQLIEMNRIGRSGGETAYQFTDGTKIKKMYVTPLLQNQLSKGLIAIVKFHDGYELVPAAVAEKISQRDESIVLVRNTGRKEEVDEDDPYADYQIPDDLMW